MIRQSTRYRLLSTPLIHSPGIVRYARNLYDTTGQGSRTNKRAAKSIMGAYSLPDTIIRKILDPSTTLNYDEQNGVVELIV